MTNVIAKWNEWSSNHLLPQDSKVKVTRWYPGVVNEIVEEVEEKTVTKGTKRRASVQDRLLTEAQQALENKRTLQTEATQEKSFKQLTEGLSIPDADLPVDPDAPPKQKARRIRHKMRSTPVFGGSLFGEETGDAGTAGPSPQKKEEAKEASNSPGLDIWKRGFEAAGHSAEINVNGETFNIRVSDETLKNMRKGFNGEASVNGRGMIVQGLSIDQSNAPVVNMLQGYVRNQQLVNIQEEKHNDIASESSGHFSET